MPVIDYIIVLDFEACWKPPIKKEEIIEFPSIIVEINTRKIIAQFRSYVKPEINVPMHEETINITGITQSQVNKAPILEKVISLYCSWLKGLPNNNPNKDIIYENQFLTKKPFLDKDNNKIVNFTFVTCGDWDLKTMLPKQCNRDKILCPKFILNNDYINIKKLFANHYKIKSKKVRGMKKMLNILGIKLVGKHHSGYDDTFNICQIAVRMMNDDCLFIV